MKLKPHRRLIAILALTSGTLFQTSCDVYRQVVGTVDGAIGIANLWL